MAMERSEHARRAVGAAYARQHCDDVTRHLLESLEQENAQLEAEVDAGLSRPGLRTGRRVFGGFVAASLLVVLGVALVSWYDSVDDEWSWRAAVNSGFYAMELKLGMVNPPAVPQSPGGAPSQPIEASSTTAAITTENTTLRATP